MEIRDVLKKIKVVGEATVLHKPGAKRLDKFPLLAYAPNQWGPGVRCESNGASVEEIAQAFALSPNIDAIAEKFSVTVEHAHQAVEYAVSVGFAAQA